jgi:diaminopimelate epimerase
VRFRSEAGVQSARQAPGGGIELHFGRVERPTDPEAVEVAGRTLRGRRIRVGVPHFVVGVEEPGGVPVALWGRELRWDPRFAPEGVNVDFVARVARGGVAMRTYERGVESETLACGSGAMASALWAAEQGERSPVEVRTAGGDALVVSFEADSGGYDVRLTGPAEVAFTGTWVDPPVS